MTKDWRERELTMEVVVGAFLVLIFLGLGYFTIILSREAVFRQRSQMQVTFSDVMGLRVGDNVVARGMPVGKVRDLVLSEDEDCAGVCVTLMLDTPVVMREGYRIRIASTSLLGGRQLQIYEGPAGAPRIEKERYQGSDPYDLMEDAAEIVNAAREAIIEGDVFARIRNITEQIEQVVTRVNAGEGLIGKLLSDDDTVYNDLQASMQAIRELVERVHRGESVVGRLLAEDAALYDDLEATMASARVIASRLEQGEGTLGKLLTDDSLYEEIEAIVSEVRAAVDDFRETAPITTFTSIFFGAF